MDNMIMVFGSNEAGIHGAGAAKAALQKSAKIGVGCGLAGFKHEQIAPMFFQAPKNCHFDIKWRPFLGKDYTYWGTF